MRSSSLNITVIGAGLSDTPTVAPAEVPAAMEHVFALYARLEDDPFAIARAHWMFETTHPFSDGNGRVGRLVMFKELLRIDAMPLIVRDVIHGVVHMVEHPVECAEVVHRLHHVIRAYGLASIGEQCARIKPTPL